MTNRKRILILGAAGRDFHNFNTVYREREDVEVVAFTATQILGIEGRTYPPSLAGPLYPEGIPILPERGLRALIRKKGIREVVFSYSDISNDYLMSVASKALTAGANFVLLSDRDTFIESKVPVVAVCAVRTGCGKSQTTRFIIDYFRSKGKRVVAIRHPMPYGDLEKQRVQRYEKIEDLDRHECTIEEREEYRPHIEHGNVVYAGVDYGDILKEAEKEADIIIWDGGNNDTSFYKPDLWITVTDPFRPEAAKTHHPGQANFIAADVILINKVNTALEEDVNIIERLAKEMNPSASVIRADSEIIVSEPAKVAGKSVAVVEDGPTLTHGNMAFGAGKVAAENVKVSRIVDPRPYAVGMIRETYEKYPKLGFIVPALGYSGQQMKDLEETLNRIEADVILSATPADLNGLLKLNKPVVNVYYELKDPYTPSLSARLDEFLEKQGKP
ncbi:MAG: cyclic 2,3-diphosphoglycerate synthase [Pseudomonadota bacterium]